MSFYVCKALTKFLLKHHVVYKMRLRYSTDSIARNMLYSNYSNHSATPVLDLSVKTCQPLSQINDYEFKLCTSMWHAVTPMLHGQF